MGTAKLKDYYEMDIAPAGITRIYGKKSDMYFTMEDKLRRFSQMLFTFIQGA